MEITAIPAADLTLAHVERWRSIQATTPALASPYFCPEFTQAVAAVRSDVYVGIIVQQGDAVAFFPHQRSKLAVGTPVGGKLSDAHGLIAPPGFGIDPNKLLRACRLAEFSFHHLLAEQQPFEAGHDVVEPSHYIDLSGGFAGYEAALKASGSHLMKDFRAKQRKLEREFGPVRFETHCEDAGLLDHLFEWKSAQYERSGLVNVFSFDWTRALLRRIHATQTPEFAGMLSVLRVGGELAAIHMGMRSQHVWNWWFPRHDERFSRGSPGLVLRLLAAQAAAEMRLSRVDLGKGGSDTYKPRLSTGTISLAAGRVERPSLAVALRRAFEGTEAWVRRSPLLPLARIPGRLIKRVERRLRFQ